MVAIERLTILNLAALKNPLAGHERTHMSSSSHIMKPGTQENRMGICYPLFVPAYLFHLDFLDWSRYHQEAF